MPSPAARSQWKPSCDAPSAGWCDRSNTPCPTRHPPHSSSRCGLEAHVPQGDPQKQNSPQDIHRVVVAAMTAVLAEHGEQPFVGNGSQELFDGGQAGAVFESVSGEQGLAHGADNRDFLGKWTERDRERLQQRLAGGRPFSRRSQHGYRRRIMNIDMIQRNVSPLTRGLVEKLRIVE